MDGDKSMDILKFRLNEHFNLYGIFNSSDSINAAIRKTNEEVVFFKNSKKNTDSVFPIELTTNPAFGNHFIASRDILRGEPILIEEPFVMAPFISSPLLKAKLYCLKCCKNCPEFCCQRCGFYFCGEQCLDEKHDLECKYLSKLNLIVGDIPFDNLKIKADKLTTERIEMQQNILSKAIISTNMTKRVETLKQYCLLAPLRTVLKISYDPGFELLIHSLTRAHIHSDGHYPKEDAVAERILQLLDNSYSKELILRIISIWNTNGFQVGSIESTTAQGLYIFSSFFNHSCVANAEQWFQPNGTIVMRSTESIKKGEPIFITYNNLLWPSRIRSSHLQYTKNFTCSCARCSDPTEFGTFIGSQFCNHCQDFYLPVGDEHTLTCDWMCKKCGAVKSSVEVQETDVIISKFINDCKKSNPIKESTMNQEKFHKNFYMQLPKRIQSLRHDIASSLSDDALLKLRKEAEEVYAIISLLYSTYSRQRATIGRSYLLICKEIRKRNHDDACIDNSQHLSKILEDTRIVLGWHPTYYRQFFTAFPMKSNGRKYHKGYIRDSTDDI